MLNRRPKSKAQLLEEIQALQERLTRLEDAQRERGSESQDHGPASEVVYRDLYEEAPVAYFSIDLDGYIQRVNRRVVELFQAARSGDEPFQAVIFDLMVPGEMDGVEAFKQIRRIDRDIKGIIMSGHGNVAVIRQHEEFGFQGKLAKPFTTDELTQVLERVIKG